MKEKATIYETLGWDQVNHENISFFKALSVDGISITGLPVVYDGSNVKEELRKKKELIESYDMKIYDVRWSVPNWKAVTNGLENRDAQIDLCCNAIRAIGDIGIPFIGYTFLSIGHFRTKSTIGRGGAKYSSFNIEEFEQNNLKQSDVGITKEKLWNNLEYFLKKVIPVAEKSGVRLALHPDDPPIDIPLGGSARIITSPESYKKIFELVPSESNAMLFCQGCFAEMGVNIFDAIRYFGTQNKICMVHFRNIRGEPYKFEEVFIDEGDIDMSLAMKTYKEAGFYGPFLVDHVPSIDLYLASRAYAIGYIRAMVQAVYRS